MQPSVLVVLGLQLLIRILKRWLPNVAVSRFNSIEVVDRNRYALRSYEQPCGTVHMAFLTRPSLSNQRYRRFASASCNVLTGAAAELEIL